MASPVGHAAAGLAAAAVVQHATHTPHSIVLWAGAFVAAGLPDLDLATKFIGRVGPAFHRNATHSIIVAVIVVAAIWLVGTVTPLDISTGVLAAWSASLLTHAPLDYLTTGPRLAAAGYGVALFWPISKKRYFSSRPRLATDRPATERPFDLVSQAAEELVRIGVPATLVVLVARGLF